MKFGTLAFRNLKSKPGRTFALTLLVLFLAFSLYGGSVLIFSLRNGLGSLEKRLGADAIVVPSTAKSKVNLDQVLLQGALGYFYMDSDILTRVKETKGVSEASAQLFLSSLKAGCCSVAIQVIGFDPEDDFVVQPWVAKSYQGTLEDYDIIIGSKLSLDVGDQLKIFDKNCNVVAKLKDTGTGMDTAAYTTMDTIRLLMASAQEIGRDIHLTQDPGSVISAVYVKAEEGYSINKVCNDLAVHLRKTETVRTKSMLTGISDSLNGVSSVMRLLIGAIWILTFLVLLVVFAMIARERRKEFAALRTLGASRGMLSRMVFREMALISLLGGIAGTVLAAGMVRGFHAVIEKRLGLPFLLPSGQTQLGLGLLCVAAVLVMGTISAAFSANRLAHVPTSRILREEN